MLLEINLTQELFCKVSSVSKIVQNTNFGNLHNEMKGFLKEGKRWTKGEGENVKQSTETHHQESACGLLLGFDGFLLAPRPPYVE